VKSLICARVESEYNRLLLSLERRRVGALRGYRQVGREAKKFRFDLLGGVLCGKIIFSALVTAEG